jgi:hypothetical protein
MSDEEQGKLVRLRADSWTLGQDQPKPRRRRKPTLSRALREAKKAGQPVSAATLAPDGSVRVSFGPIEPELSEANAPRDASVVASDRIVELCKRRG